MTLRGKVKNGVVLFESDTAPPNGTLVEVTLVEKGASASPKPPVGGPPYPVSAEQRKALLRLIGCCKTENPPSDEEVERMIDDYRMKKYG